MTFDILKDPPTKEELEAERRRIERIRFGFIAWYVLLGAMLLVYSVGYPLIRNYISDSNIEVLRVVVVISIFVLVIFICAVNTSDDEFYGISISAIETLIKLCDSIPELSAYRDKVVRLGRELTYGEYLAMKKYARDNKEAHELREKKAVLYHGDLER